MAAFSDLLQRIVRDLEQAGAQQPGDDLRARLGYGTGDDVDDVDDMDDVDEPEPGQRGHEGRRRYESRRRCGSR